jgi:hypothetical protein
MHSGSRVHFLFSISLFLVLPSHRVSGNVSGLLLSPGLGSTVHFGCGCTLVSAFLTFCSSALHRASGSVLYPLRFAPGLQVYPALLVQVAFSFQTV